MTKELFPFFIVDSGIIVFEKRVIWSIPYNKGPAVNIFVLENIKFQQ